MSNFFIRRPIVAMVIAILTVIVGGVTIVSLPVAQYPNTDLILTQSREQLASGQLPPDVNTYGVTIRKSVTAPLMLIGIFSPKGTYDTKFLGNYAYINLNDPIARLYGVGQTQVFGAGQYAMRLWVQPDK